MPEGVRFVGRAARRWKRAPILAASIIAITSLGIAGVASLFGPLYSLVLAPLALPHSEQLVHVGGEIPVFNVYTKTVQDRSRFENVFAHFAVYAAAGGGSTQWRFQDRARLVEINALAVSPEFFETLGVAMQSGHGFLEEATTSKTVVISDRLWRSQLHQALDVVGSTVEVGGNPRTVIGVMPSGFEFPGGVDAWMPIGSSSYVSDGLETVARLRLGISASQAAVALGAVGQRPAQGASGQFGAPGAAVESFQRYLRGDTRSTLWTLWAVSGLFLLVSCVGVVNLLLAHGVRRREEMLIRASLGASRRQLIGQLLFETLLLVMVAAFAAFWLSWAGGAWIVHLFVGVPAAQPVAPALLALVCALVISVTVICGLAPALHLTRADAQGPFVRVAARFSKPGRFLAREVLAAAQVALALALLVGAGLLARSLRAHIDVPIGLRPTNVIAFRLILPHTPERLAAEAAARSHPSRVTPPNSALNAALKAEFIRNRAFFLGLTRGIAALPSVADIGALVPIPFESMASQSANTYQFASRMTAPGGTKRHDDVRTNFGMVSPNGFDVLGIPLLAGRRFTEDDVVGELAASLARYESNKAPEGATPVIINEALAHRLWQEEDPIGKYFYTGRSNLVIGVVTNYQWAPSVPKDRPAFFSPFTGAVGTLVVARLRDSAAIKLVSDEIDRIAASLMVDVPSVRIERLDALVGASQQDLRTTLGLLGGFAGLGFLVAGLGVYTSVTLLVASKTRDLGIRVALGATRRSVRLLLIRHLARLLAALPLGWALGWGIARLLSHLLFGVTATDPATYVISTIAVIVAVGVAAIVPVFRAGATSPAVVLRSD